MKQLAYRLTTFFLTLSHLTFACDCVSAGQFLTVAPKTELVSLVKVIKYLTFKAIYDKQTPMSMEVEIIKTFKGNETRKSIVVWGDNGNLCRPYLSQFETGKYYVIAFDKGYDGSKGYVHSDEKTTDYSISNCGDYWLTANIETKTANGSVSATQSNISFGDLWEQFHGDKTKEMKPNDFKEIYQLAFDLPELQQYYHIETDTTRKQIIIQYFGEADGAIFGMYGVFLAMLTTNLIEKTARKALLTSIGIFVGYNLIYGLKGGIDNAAHIGGLVGGLVIGYALIPSLKKPEENKLKFGTIGLLSILILVSSFVVYKKLPNDIGTYDAKIKEFVSMESMALEVYNLPQNTPNDKILYGIKDRGIYYWNENIKLIDGFKDLDLPLEIRTRNRLLKEYCELRIKSYELLYKAISEDTEQYKSQIEDYNQKIDAKLKELGVGQ
jgi:hypothetical protein